MEGRDLREIQSEIETGMADLRRRGPAAQLLGWLSRLLLSRRARFGLVAAMLVVGTGSSATPISIPYTFSNGTVADANAVNANFSILIAESNAKDSRLLALEAALGSLQPQVASNATAIGTLQSDISTLQTNVATNTSDVGMLQSGIATNALAIATNRSNITTNTSGISTNTSGIAANIAAIATNTGDIQTLSGGVVVTINSGNFQTVAVASYDLVRLDGTVIVSANYAELNKTSLTVHGGGFQGTGTQQVNLGTRTTVIGTAFQDLVLGGNDITFINCRFDGAITFPYGATVIGGKIVGVTQAATNSLGRLIGVEINNSTILRATGLSNCRVDNSTLGGTATSSNSVGNIADCRVNNSILYVRNSDRITGNYFYQSHVRVWGVNSGGNASGLMVISGNSFDNIYGGQSEALSIDMSTAAYYSLTVEGNNFIIQPGDPQAILVAGTPSGGWQYQLVQLSGNNFLKGTKAIQYSGTVRTAVDGNVVRATSLGVSTSGNLQVGQNFVF